jgi:hypothetical protein
MEQARSVRSSAFNNGGIGGAQEKPRAKLGRENWPDERRKEIDIDQSISAKSGKSSEKARSPPVISATGGHGISVRVQNYWTNPRKVSFVLWTIYDKSESHKYHVHGVNFKISESTPMTHCRCHFTHAYDWKNRKASS